MNGIQFLAGSGAAALVAFVLYRYLIGDPL